MGQISDKTGCCGGKSLVIMSIYTLLMIGTVVLIYLGILPSTMSTVFTAFFMTICGIILRLKIIEIYGIRGHGTGAECCLACCCPHLSLCQIARHVYGYSDEKYFDGDMDRERPDGYAESLLASQEKI